MERGDSQFLVNRRVFAMPDTGVPDGISCDSAGNVYAACGDGLNVWNEIGMLIGKVLIPGGIASFCFGKPGELFLLGGERFWNFKVAQHVKGALLISAGLQPGSPERDSSVESMPSLFGGRNEGRNERLNEGQNM
jgi:gluconolactonase